MKVIATAAYQKDSKSYIYFFGEDLVQRYDLDLEIFETLPCVPNIRMESSGATKQLSPMSAIGLGAGIGAVIGTVMSR